MRSNLGKLQDKALTLLALDRILFLRLNFSLQKTVAQEQRRVYQSKSGHKQEQGGRFFIPAAFL